MRIISDGLFFYTKVSDKLTHDIITFFNSNQGDEITNIAGKAIIRNGFARFPLACYPKWITILQDFCMQKDIVLIWTEHIDSTGEGLSKLIELFTENNVKSTSTGVLKLDEFLNLR